MNTENRSSLARSRDARWDLLLDGLSCWLLSIGVILAFDQLFRFHASPAAIVLHPLLIIGILLLFYRRTWLIPILLLAGLCVAAIVLLAAFVVRSLPQGRSCFYAIGAASAVTIYVVQAMLNVFGTTDLLPLTGVTFPFVSNGGSSMICVWGLLAFIKAADTRQNASFAIRLPKRKEAAV